MRRIFETSRGRPELLNSALNKSNIILRSTIGKYFIYNLRGGRQPYTVEGLVEMPSNEITNTCRLVYLRSFDSFSSLKEENVSMFESNAHLSFMIKTLPRICCFFFIVQGPSFFQSGASFYFRNNNDTSSLSCRQRGLLKIP